MVLPSFRVRFGIWVIPIAYTSGAPNYSSGVQIRRPGAPARTGWPGASPPASEVRRDADPTWAEPLADEHSAEHQRHPDRLDRAERLVRERDPEQGPDHRVDQPDDRHRTRRHQPQSAEPADVGDAGADAGDPEEPEHRRQVERRRRALDDEPDRQQHEPADHQLPGHQREHVDRRLPALDQHEPDGADQHRTERAGQADRVHLAGVAHAPAAPRRPARRGRRRPGPRRPARRSPATRWPSRPAARSPAGSRPARRGGGTPPGRSAGRTSRCCTARARSPSTTSRPAAAGGGTPAAPGRRAGRARSPRRADGRAAGTAR